MINKKLNKKNIIKDLLLREIWTADNPVEFLNEHPSLQLER